jgi:signal transduction histidine kinase
MSVLVDDLVDAGEVEARRISLRRASHVAGTLLDEVADELRPVACARQVLLVRRRLSGDEVRCDCDAARVHQILTNLLGNAIKYAPPRSVVLLTAEHEAGWVRLSVADEGPGIATHEASHLFDRYFRGRDAHGAGAGLGLSIAKELVELHGGTIGVDARSGGGSIFHFTLPAAAHLEAAS